MRCRIGATPTSRPRSRRSSTISRRRRRPTAISTAGICGASRRTAGPTFATITSSTMPATCSKAPSPISRRPDGAAARHHGALCRPHRAQTFGPEPGQKRGYCGHQEIELALIKLYHLTGEKKHLDLADLFRQRARPPAALFRRGGDRPRRGSEEILGEELRIQPVAQAGARAGQGGRPRGARHVPVHGDGRPRRRAQRRRAEARLRALWDDVMSSKMYVTAGPRPAAANEGFTYDYDLPNETAYAETCASVALIFWAQRMLHLDLDGKYADVLELALFNGALTGLAATASTISTPTRSRATARHSRWDWHTCPCCTMNVVAARRLGRRLFRFGERGRHRLPSLWRHFHRGRR